MNEPSFECSQNYSQLTLQPGVRRQAAGLHSIERKTRLGQIRDMWIRGFLPWAKCRKIWSGFINPVAINRLVIKLVYIHFLSLFPLLFHGMNVSKCGLVSGDNLDHSQHATDKAIHLTFFPAGNPSNCTSIKWNVSEVIVFQINGLSWVRWKAGKN